MRRLHRWAGVVAIVVAAGAFYVSYNANSGLPWQSTYEVSVEVRNALRVGPDDEVRIGGIRVGRVADVTALPPRDGHPARARAKLALDRSVGRLPVDTRVRIRPSSVLGASYVDLSPGRATDTVEDGGELGLEQSTRGVELTELFDIFERSTAQAIRRSLEEIGVGFAGRGADLNATIASLERLLPPLTRVSAALAAPAARLRDFIVAYESFASALAPSAPQLAALVEGGATTFDVLARERVAVGDSIATFPPAAATTTDALTRLQPSLRRLATLADELRPAAPLVPVALEEVNRTIELGRRPMRELPAFARPLQATLAALDRVTRMPSTDGTLRKLRETMVAVRETLEVLTPAQVYCNVIPLYSNFSRTLGTIGVGREGPSFAFATITDAGAENESFQSPEPSRDVAINYLPNENANECESGNERHDGKRQLLGNPPGYQSRSVPQTEPPPGVRERARRAGLIDPPKDSR